MTQATDQGGSDNPWKRQSINNQAFRNQFECLVRVECLDASSDDALLVSMDPSLARTAESLQQRQISKTETIYENDDAPTRRTFISDERHVKLSADLIAERFGITPTRAQRTRRVTTQRGI
jgi:hypothetical protein